MIVLMNDRVDELIVLMNGSFRDSGSSKIDLTRPMGQACPGGFMPLRGSRRGTGGVSHDVWMHDGGSSMGVSSMRLSSDIKSAINESINQSMDRSINQSINQPIDQRINFSA